MYPHVGLFIQFLLTIILSSHASPSIPPDGRPARGPSVHHQGQHRRGSGTGHRHRRSHFGPSQGSNVSDSPARKLPRHSLPSPSSSHTGPGVQTAPLSFVRGPLPSSGEQPATEGPGHHAPSAPLEQVVWLPSLTMAFLGCTTCTSGLLTLPQSNMG